MAKDAILFGIDILLGLWGLGVGLPYLLQFPARIILVNLLHVLPDFTISINPTPVIPIACLIIFLYRRRNLGLRLARKFFAVK